MPNNAQNIILTKSFTDQGIVSHKQPPNGLIHLWTQVYNCWAKKKKSGLPGWGDIIACIRCQLLQGLGCYIEDKQVELIPIPV